MSADPVLIRQAIEAWYAAAMAHADNAATAAQGIYGLLNEYAEQPSVSREVREAALDLREIVEALRRVTMKMDAIAHIRGVEAALAAFAAESEG